MTPMTTSLRTALAAVAGLTTMSGAVLASAALAQPADLPIPARHNHQLSRRDQDRPQPERPGLCQSRRPNAVRHGHAHRAALVARCRPVLSGGVPEGLGAAARPRRVRRQHPVSARRRPECPAPRRLFLAAQRARTGPSSPVRRGPQWVYKGWHMVYVRKGSPRWPLPSSMALRRHDLEHAEIRTARAGSGSHRWGSSRCSSAANMSCQIRMAACCSPVPAAAIVRGWTALSARMAGDQHRGVVDRPQCRQAAVALSRQARFFQSGWRSATGARGGQSAEAITTAPGEETQ